MKQLDKDLAVGQTIVLMTSYSFDLQGYKAEQLVSQWLANYHPTWIRLATIEALYLGRYKAISIEQIMSVWSRLGNPKVHFGGEFERLICRKLPRHLVKQQDIEPVSPPATVTSSTDQPIGQSKPESAKKSKPSTAANQLETEPPTKLPAKNSQVPSLDNSELHWQNSSNSIERFTPIPDMSSLFQKLKAIAKTE
ncbi:MAG TPA: hypothetical protein ACFCUY_04580 [Xenococcaceae cyanobacterium]|jgi:hypothetical protein